MRILSVGNMYPPHHSGGYELVWRSAVAALRADGHSVRVLTTDHRTAATEPDEPDVHRELRWYWRDHEFPRRSLAACVAIERANRRTFERHVRDLRPDVIAWWSMGGMSLSLLERARRSGLPAVAFVHDDWLDYGRRTDGWYRRFAGRPRRARLAERVTGIPTRVDFAAAARYEFVSETTRARALIGGLALHESGIAHSGIDAALLSPAPPRPWTWRLLYLGRIDPRKGIDTAVAALSHLPRQATLTVAGDGDGRERERLGALIAELGLEGRVAFAGPCPRAELQERYAGADAVLFPVRWAEPWGLVPLEAMAVGRPVLATGRGGSGEYLRDGVNCVLFAAGDPAALARAVERLAEDPGLRERLREGGLRTAPQHTEERFNRAVIDALTNAAAHGRDDAPATAGVGAAQARQPRLTVVIPTLARNERLSRTLDALARQDLDGASFEVIVVPDPDSDTSGLDEVLESAVRGGLAVRRVDRHAPGVGAARNAGWRAARAPLVLFLGDDILASPDLLRSHLAWHDAHPDPRVGVLGHVRWARELRVTPFMRWLEHGLQFNYPSIDGVDAGFGHFYTANVSLKRAMLERVGGSTRTGSLSSTRTSISATACTWPASGCSTTGAPRPSTCTPPRSSSGAGGCAPPPRPSGPGSRCAPSSRPTSTTASRTPRLAIPTAGGPAACCCPTFPPGSPGWASASGATRRSTTASNWPRPSWRPGRPIRPSPSRSSPPVRRPAGRSSRAPEPGSPWPR